MVAMTTFITQALLAPVIKEAGEKISKLAFNGISKNSIITAFKRESLVNEYADKIVKKVFSIRTLSQGEKTLYLDEIYHPLSISSAQTESNITISESSSMPYHTCHCIVGVAGQGKTTIMKKLFLEELVRAERFPFFITMRQFDFSEGISCEDILLSHLKNHGIECSLSDVTQLLQTQKVVFYFDGFDEVPLDNRRNALSVVESVNDKFGCQTITSSRPDTDITRSSNIEVYNVDFLKENDIESIIQNIVKNVDNQKTLLSILRTKDFLKESIKTPILVDVFIVTSSALKNDPNSIGEYYDGLFSALIYRHDLLKNLNRDKKSDLNDRELEECFSLLSFLSFINNQHDFTRKSLLDLIKNSCDAKKYEENERDVYQDMINGTNLIVKDGYDNYVYIHRSIQEYYCSKTISMLKERDKTEFYEKLLATGRMGFYINLFVMLSHIDYFDLIRLFIIPYLQETGCYSSYFHNPLNKEEFTNEILANAISIRENEDHVSIYSPAGLDNNNWRGILAIDTINRILDSGKYSSSSDLVSDKVMMRDSEKICSYLIDNKQNLRHKVSKETDEFKFFKRDDSEVSENIISFELKDAAHLIEGFDEILEESYLNYINKCNSIRDFINEKYYKLLERNSSISSLIGNISFGK